MSETPSIQDDVKALREALAGPLVPGPWAVCQEPPNDLWFKGRTIGAANPSDARRVADAGLFGETEAHANYISACSPDRIKRVLDALDEKDTKLAKLSAGFLVVDARLSKAMDLLREWAPYVESFWLEGGCSDTAKKHTESFDAFLKEQPEEPSDFCPTCGADRTKAEP